MPQHASGVLLMKTAKMSQVNVLRWECEAGLPDGCGCSMVPREGKNSTRILIRTGFSSLRGLKKYFGGIYEVPRALVWCFSVSFSGSVWPGHSFDYGHRDRSEWCGCSQRTGDG